MYKVFGKGGGWTFISVSLVSYADLGSSGVAEMKVWRMVDFVSDILPYIVKVAWKKPGEDRCYLPSYFDYICRPRGHIDNCKTGAGQRIKAYGTRHRGYGIQTPDRKLP